MQRLGEGPIQPEPRGLIVAQLVEELGIDQIAINPDNGKLYVDGGRALLILDPEDGQQSGSIHTGDATGVCFAQIQRHTPILDIVYNAP